MDSAINRECNNATAFGAADAPEVDVRASSEKYATRTLNILQLNINGTQKKLDELSVILQENNIHVACLQETKLNPNLKMKIKGYSTVRKDREDRSGGGLAFLIKSTDVKYKTCINTTNQITSSNTEVQAIDIFLPHHTLRIINVYHPDNTDIDVNLISDLTETTADTKLILGDFNAKSPSWGSSAVDRKGLQLEDLLDDINFSVLNDGKVTYVSKTNGTAEVLDVTTINHLSERLTSWTVLESAISDHLPVLTKVHLRLDTTKQNKRSWNFRKADWPNFTSKLEELCDLIKPTSSLNDRVSSFTACVNRAARLYIPRGKRRTDWVPYWSDNNIDSLISERDSMCKEVQGNNTEINRKRYVDLCQKVEEEISRCKRMKWESFCETLNPSKEPLHWNVIKILNNQISEPKVDMHTTNSISSNGRLSRTDKETATMLAKYYATNSKLTFNKADKALLKNTRKLIRDSIATGVSGVFSDPLSMEELDSAISKIDPKKAPGADLVFGSMIMHFGEKAKKQLLEIFNLSWTSGKLPQIWKTSIVIPILKPNKPANECSSYRPISLTSILCKLMERIIHSRLMKWLIEEKKIHFYQTAYRAHHSTVDQLFYLCQSVIDGLQEKPHKKTTAVFLDLSAAFDRVWRQKLLHIIHDIGIGGNALVWINDFLRGRRFSVKVNGALSNAHRTWAGVPQGSVLSPLLFLLYMNTIDSHIQHNTKVACYADDIAIWNTSKDLKLSEKSLNLTMQGIAAWATDLKLTINPSKSSYCIFSTDRKHRGNFNLQIKLNECIIKRVNYPKYLGVTLDPELRFTKHIEETANKALKKLNILRRLCGTNWGSRPSTLKTTYCTMIRPILEYSSPVWAPASGTVNAKIDTIQYRAAKIIIGAVSSTNNLKAELECGLVSLERRRKLATVKFTNKIRSYNEDHISKRVLNVWKESTRLHRSSTLHFDKEIRQQILLEHDSLDILPEPLLPLVPPTNARILLDLVEPCSKRDPPQVLFQLGTETINTFSDDNKVLAFTDGSSDNSFERGGAGILIIHPLGTRTEIKIPTGQIASNFTSELIAIKEALSYYYSNPSNDSTDGLVIFSDSKSALEAIKNGTTNLTQDINLLIGRIEKPCVFQWIPAHVGIEGNECADILAKEARDLNQLTTVTFEDANAVARRRIFVQSFRRPLISELDCPRNLSSIIARLRTGHFKGMKISPDGARRYPICRNCPETELTPEHLFNCQAIIASLFTLDAQPWETLYSSQAPELADLVVRAFGSV